jgi:hypothetical protein
MELHLKTPYEEIKNTDTSLIETEEGFNLDVINLTKAVYVGAVQVEMNKLIFADNLRIKTESAFALKHNLFRFGKVGNLKCHFTIESRNPDKDSIRAKITDNLIGMGAVYFENIRTFGLEESDLFQILEENNVVLKANINNFIVLDHSAFFSLIGKEELTGDKLLSDLMNFLKKKRLNK